VREAHFIVRPFLCWATVLLCAGAIGPVFGESGSPVEVETAPDGVQRISITMDSYSYRPNHLIVRVGQPVELTLTSVTILTPHNFVLKDPAAGLSVEQDVGAGKTATVRFTPTVPGVFTFYCDKKLLFFASHREKGMEGRLEVR